MQNREKSCKVEQNCAKIVQNREKSCKIVQNRAAKGKMVKKRASQKILDPIQNRVLSRSV